MARALAEGAVAEADLSDADIAMLKYALKLTLEPHAITGSDVGDLRTHDFDDAAIHDICHVTSYYNYVNRMADGLGVELEDRWSEEELTLTRDDFEVLLARHAARREG